MQLWQRIHSGIQHVFIYMTIYGHLCIPKYTHTGRYEEDLNRAYDPINPQLRPACHVLAEVQQGKRTRQRSPDTPQTALPHAPLPLAAPHSHHLSAVHFPSTDVSLQLMKPRAIISSRAAITPRTYTTTYNTRS